MKAYIFHTSLGSIIDSLPFILLGGLIVLWSWQRRHQPVRWFWLAAFAGLIITLVNIFVNTLSFVPFLDGFQLYGNINLVPFVSILRMIDDLLSATPSHYSFINFFGNIGFFIPLGFFPPFLSKRLNRGWKVILIGFGTSLFIEVFQLFIPARGSDIDDILLNTCGTAIGFLLFWIVARCFPKFIRLFHD